MTATPATLSIAPPDASAPAEQALTSVAATLAMESGISAAVRLAGNQTALARLLGVSPQAVQKWVSARCVPPERCLSIERALSRRVDRYALNPRIFGKPPS